jgi:hypothetical protein
LYFILQISSINKLILAVLLILTVALINLPVNNLVELSSQELFMDFENEQNNNEIDNELDEYINSSMLTFSNQSYSNLNTNNLTNHYQIFFLDIESPPPDLN